MYSTPSKRISKGWTSSLSTTSAICWQSSNSVTLRWTPTTRFSCTTRAWTQKTFSVQLMQFRLFSLLQHRGLKPVCLQSPAQQESCTLPVQPGLGPEKSGCCSQTHHSSCTTHLNSQFPPVKGEVIFTEIFMDRCWTSCMTPSSQCGLNPWNAVLQSVPAGTGNKSQWYPKGPEGFPCLCWLTPASLSQQVTADGWSSSRVGTIPIIYGC